MSSFLGKLNAPLSSPLVRGLLWFIAGAAVASAAFIDEGRSSRWVLRTYTVAPSLEIPLRRALEYTMNVQGRIIETGVGGQLLISAPRRIQQQIPSLLASFGNAATSSPTLQFDVWYLVATQGPANVDDPTLQSVRDALQQIVKIDGPTRFELRQRKGVRVHVGATAEAGPVLQRIRTPRLLKRADGTVAIVAGLDLGDVDSFDARLETEVEMVPGETLVIGRTTRKGAAGLETLYQIVRASL